jgi:hypothetical protein
VDEASKLSPSTVPSEPEDCETQPAREPATTMDPQPAAEAANNRLMAEEASAPVTETIPAGAKITQSVPDADNTEVNHTTPTSTCQAAAEMKAKENIAPIAAQSDTSSAPTQPSLQSSIEKEVSRVEAALLVPLGSTENSSLFNFQTTADAMPSDGSLTSLLDGFNWGASSNYNSLGNGTWDETQALFNFDFLSEGMGGMKDTGGELTMGLDLRLPDDMLLNQPAYPLLGPSQLNLNTPWIVAGAASIPNTAHGLSAQDFTATTGNPLTSSPLGAQPSALGDSPHSLDHLVAGQGPVVSIATPVIQQASNGEKGNRLTPSQPVSPNLSPPPLTSPKATIDEAQPISEQDGQQIIQQGRSRKPTKTKELQTLTEQTSTLPEWLTAAEEYLCTEIEVDVWKNCLNNWVTFEKEHGMLEHSSVSVKNPPHYMFR